MQERHSLHMRRSRIDYWKYMSSCIQMNTQKHFVFGMQHNLSHTDCHQWTDVSTSNCSNCPLYDEQ